MALDFKISDAVRNIIVNAVTADINSGSGAGRIEIRAGTPPGAVSTSSGANVLLGTLTFSPTAFGAASGGTASANSITQDSSADASGTASYFRVFKGGAAETAGAWQGTAGVSGDTPNMVFNNKTIILGGIIAVNSFTITMPAS